VAYNAEQDVLWLTSDNQLLQVDPGTCNVLGALLAPAPQIRGLDVDANGDLWTTDPATNTVYLLDSGVPHEKYHDVPWLSASATSGSLAPGKSQTVTVTLDSAGVDPGRYLAALAVDSNAGATPNLQIPVALSATDRQVALDAGATADYHDPSGDTWQADRRYQPGSSGRVDEGSTVRTSSSITQTDADPLYQSAELGANTYRFDDLPNGVYQVDLRFAEIQNAAPGSRVFDVAAEGQVVLPAVDVAGAAGRNTAYDQTVLVTVADGGLDVDLRASDGSAPPLLSAIRVTHRPDLSRNS
jgi:hypothetical protein